MASPPLTVALPPNLDLGGACEIHVTALDAATGAEMAGVNVFNVTLEVDTLSGGALAYGPFMLVTGPSG